MNLSRLGLLLGGIYLVYAVFVILNANGTIGASSDWRIFLYLKVIFPIGVVILATPLGNVASSIGIENFAIACGVIHACCVYFVGTGLSKIIRDIRSLHSKY